MNVPVNRFADVVAVRTAGATSRTIDGETFAYDDTGTGVPIWGRGAESLWERGEPMMIFGPDGVGKTTLVQRLIRARLGLDVDPLGYPMEPSTGVVLYVAGDRPKQAGRSFRRMVADDDRQALRERLRVHRGPLPFDLVHEPDRLTEWAKGDMGASDVFLDSLGALVGRLTDDETGSAISRAFTLAVTEGLEIVSNHHPRKANAENRKPREIADVYGSRWITACHGSILCLWGNPGDPVVELRHLKQPNEEVGPFSVVIEQSSGGVDVLAGSDLFEILRASPNGLTAPEAAQFFQGGSDQARDHKARRQLERLVSRGFAHRRDGDPLPGSGARKAAVRYFAVTRIPEDVPEDTPPLGKAEDKPEDAEDGFRETAGQSEDAPGIRRGRVPPRTGDTPSLEGVPRSWPPPSKACLECGCQPWQGDHFAACSNFVPRTVSARASAELSPKEAATDA